MTTAALLAVGLLLVLAGAAVAGPSAHDPWKLKEVRVDHLPLDSAPGKCENCHTLDPNEGEPNTSHISSTARTLLKIKLYGGSTPAIFGCTFCHSNMLDNIYMDDVLADFETTTIQHPVGVTFSGANINNEYLSNITSTALTTALNCNDCHNTTLLTYPAHEARTTDTAWTGTWNVGVNPYALKNVAALADKDKAFCLTTCHGSAGAYRTKHYDWGGFNGTYIFDPSGQTIKALSGTTTSCSAICHDTHTSVKDDLLQDGLDRGSAEGTAVDPANCTAVCHNVGAMPTRGHGQFSQLSQANTYCTPCHSSTYSHRDTSSAQASRRLGMGYPDANSSTIALNKAADGKDNDMDGFLDAADTGGVGNGVAESAFVYSRNSICKTCHTSYAGHGGTSTFTACLDCHDVHGDDAVANNNAAMIRSTLAGESTVFTAADRSAGVFYKSGASNGLCDNNACHASITTSLAANHKGGASALTQPCSDCHSTEHPKDSSVASFKVNKCDGCHGYPPVNDMTGKGTSGNYIDAALENYTNGGHGHDANDHVLRAATQADGWTPCLKCHPDTGHNEGGGVFTRANVDVTVPSAYSSKGATASYAFGAQVSNGTCSNVSCHGGVSITWVGAISTATQCTSCHVVENVADRASASEYQSAFTGMHAITTTVSGYVHRTGTAVACGGCHSGGPANHFGDNLLTSGLVEITTANGNFRSGITIPAGPSHDPTLDTCAVNCHKDGGRWARPNDKVKAVLPLTNAQVCDTCHGKFFTAGSPVSGTYHRTDTTGSSTQSNHGSTGSGVSAGCNECHGWGNTGSEYVSTWGSAKGHGNGLITLNNNTANVARDGNTLTGCSGCHAAFDGIDGDATQHSFVTTPWGLETISGGPISGCQGCHGSSGTGQFWPDGSNGSPAYCDDAKGAHNKHLSAIGIYLGYNDWTGTMYTAEQQKTICAFCHPGTPGESGHTTNTANPSNRVDVDNDTAVGNYFKKFTGTPGSGGYADDNTGSAGDQAYNFTTQGCSNLVCHSLAATQVNGGTWASPVTSAGCLVCHNNNNYTEGHAVHANTTAKGYACTQCHTSNTTDTHQNATVTLVWNNAGSFEQTYGNGSVTYTQGNNLNFRDATWGTCADAACHKNVTTKAWNVSITTYNCMECHSLGGGGSNPTTGLHNVTPTISGKAHNQNLGTTETGCTVCHSMAALGTHVNGSFIADSSSNTDRGLFDDWHDGAANAGTCYSTGAGNEVGAANCHDSTADVGTWARKWTTAVSGSTGNECGGCHGTFTQGWIAGVGVDHLKDWDGDTSSEVRLWHDNGSPTETQYNQCISCHVYNQGQYGAMGWQPNSTSSHHGDNNIDMNSTVGYNQTTWECSAACHGTPNHNLSDSGLTVQLIAGSTLSCDGCHTYTTHLKATRGGADQACSYCHVGHTGGVLYVPVKTAVGINLAISLGNTSTGVTGATEAEICWNCHDNSSPYISEWGTNTGGTYNYGILQVSSSSTAAALNWISGYWRSAQTDFAYKKGPLANKPTWTSPEPGTTDGGSVHATGGTVGTQNEALSNVRCSYCHDVHDNIGPSGKPYLRGSWRPSPYKEDGAPRSGFTYSGGNSYGNVPRGNTTSTRAYGGFWIDQNSGNPNSSYSYATNDGLCNLCHAESGLSTSKPLHKNAVRGFANDTAAARNVFSDVDRNPGGVGTTNTNGNTSRPNQNYDRIMTTSSVRAYGFRSLDSDGFRFAPILSNNYAGYLNPWGLTIDSTTVSVDYHSFSCSKCHIPHASRLPALMITNCLDTRVNTWDDNLARATGMNGSSHTIATTCDSYGHRTANYTSAQNCHRVGRTDTTEGTTGTGKGWNTVTPW